MRKCACVRACVDVQGIGRERLSARRLILMQLLAVVVVACGLAPRVHAGELAFNWRSRADYQQPLPMWIPGVVVVAVVRVILAVRDGGWR